MNEFYSIALNDYDVVLGAKWLKATGPVGWDFSKMLLSFTHDNQEIVLQGLFSKEITLILGKQLRKV